MGSNSPANPSFRNMNIHTAFIPSFLKSPLKPTLNTPKLPTTRLHLHPPTIMSAAPSRPKPCLAATIASAHITRDSSGLTVIAIDGFSKRPTPWWFIALLLSAVVWVVRRIVVLRHIARVYKRKDLSQDIANFYDIRSAAWEAVWGEHMHHGLYDVVQGKRLRGREAQIRTVSELLKMGNLLDVSLPKGTRILDVGCGIGGASRILARHFGNDCHVTGITLSPFQAERARQLNKALGLEGRVQNTVKDALSNDFPDDHFDVVWSMESGEHIKDKYRFMHECARVLKPGGKFLMLVWCIRESTPPFKVSEQFAIRRIMEEFCLPRLAPPSEYITTMLRCGLRGVRVEDWTKRAAPFWGEVVQSAAFNPKGWAVLLEHGWPLLRSTLATRHVIAGIKRGVFRLVAITAHNPTETERRQEAMRAEGCCSKNSLPRQM